MLLKYGLNIYNLFLSLGAFYVGVPMFLGLGEFDTFPQEWVGEVPFNSWASLALFGVAVFGIGNAIASIYGFIKKDQKIFTMTFAMGLLFFFTTVISTVLVGEWYMPTGIFLILSIIQISLGLFGFVIYYITNGAAINLP